MAYGKVKIAVLAGGPSPEHEVSLKTGEAVLKNLGFRKFEPFPVKIGKDGAWPITIEELKAKADIAFIAMHGEYGEDGQIQSLLETFKIPYTGSGPAASVLAADKQKTAALLAKNGLATPASILVIKDDPDAEWAIQRHSPLPFMVKPVNCGSSIGVSLVKAAGDLKPSLFSAFKNSPAVLAQKYVAGREVSCGVLEINGIPLPLLPSEIIPSKSEFFDYYEKYNSKGAKNITPPNLSPKVIRKIQMTALKAHKLLGCSGMSQTDMILGRDGNLHVLELDAIPAMSETSLFSKQAAAMGIEFPQLLEIIINNTIRRFALNL